MDRDLALSIAKGLLHTFSKAKNGMPTKWAQISEAERALWLRLTLQVMRRVNEHQQRRQR